MNFLIEVAGTAVLDPDYSDNLVLFTSFQHRQNFKYSSKRQNFKYFGFGKRSLMVPNFYKLEMRTRCRNIFEDRDQNI